MLNGFKEYDNWDSYVVPQCDKYWCIPMGYEILLRAKGKKGINSSEFQKKVYCGEDKSNLKTVGEKVKIEYPDINLRYDEFLEHEGRTGKDKLNEIERLFDNRIFILVSLSAIGPLDYIHTNREDIIFLRHIKSTHIMPIIGMNEKFLFLFNGMDEKGIKYLSVVSKDILVLLHDNVQGGHDIAYLE